MPSNISKDNKYINQVCRNVKSDLIEITEDKLNNILSEFILNYKKVQSWITPLTLSISILLVILTADFNKDFLGIKKEIWSAIFYLSLIACICWLIWCILNIIKYYKKTRLDYIIKKIKND